MIQYTRRQNVLKHLKQTHILKKVIKKNEESLQYLLGSLKKKNIQMKSGMRGSFGEKNNRQNIPI